MMQVVLAHAGHDHGPDPALVALLVALAVLAILVAGTALRRARARRQSLGVGGDEGM
ncbi:MAG TPA: hypothetical protein VFZ85_08055 [Jiangellaceae bacterium]